MSKKLRVGVMGSGWVAMMRHIPALKRTDRAEIVAIYNPYDATLDEVAERFSIPHAEQDLDAFFQHDLDAVVICTPPRTHAELIERALTEDVHVLSEKPLTIDEADGKRLADLAKKQGLKFCASHNFLYSRSVTKAHQLIREGKIGEVISANGVQWSSTKRPLPSWYRDLPGNLFFDESPHLIYMLQSFVGHLEVDDAWYDEREVAGEPFEQYEIRLKGQHANATIHAYFGAPVSEWFMVVMGTKGAIVLDIFRDIAIHVPEEKVRDPKYLISSVANVDRHVWGGIVNWIVTRFTKGSHLFGSEELTRRFVDAVLDDAELPVPMDQGWQVVKVINDILRKAGILKDV